ncbi:ribosomal protein S12 methylthiotransferase accessory factor [Maridesulfovibrio ferrireducens]|uniref:Ribosomal protein S12 methylthiotransferase accessory factor n=1 Tax=Maridesulfovibrio ferrireducens TaxID=246191 RepID=A0A1G9KSY3_9BACT|nr:TOMM precursor leader peptide-binding protein [Maridesulfovibrio ferrireducens]SDL52930.1 ribosomal protein S12 methylthiotransferase accessory factor [Maridesulfovibrio ferrireducens]
MTKLLRFKPWLEPALIDDKNALILSETTSHTLKGELLITMLPLLDGSRSEDDIVDELSDRFDMSEIFYQLIQLKKVGLVEAVPKQEWETSAIFHDRMECDLSKLDSPTKIIVTSLNSLDPQPIADHLSGLKFCKAVTADWQKADLNDGAIWIVLTSNYLDPNLEIFNARAHKSGTRWLPYKPDGIEPWFGPLVDPGETACVECLLHRLRGHRIKELQIASKKGELPRFSQGRTAASLNVSCSLLGLELEKFLSGSSHCFIDKGVVTIDLKTLETSRHELTRRSHCPICGNAEACALSGFPEEEFTLTSQPKADYNDGGERIKAATETMARFETRISPITGEVGTLNVQENVPEFFGRAVSSSWATLNGHKMDSSKGRIAAVGMSAGKGRSEIQARTSALGEALERYCSQYFGYEPCLKATYTSIADDALHPLELNQFTDSQYENREEWAKRAHTGSVPKRFDENTSVDWTPTWSLTNKRWKYVPSAFMYYQYPKENGGRFIYGDSNGVAAGNCVEEAIIQGFFELVERDGVALWWYNMLQRPCLDLPSFGSAFAMEAAEGLRRHNHSLHVLDLTTDLGIPVFAAVGLHYSDPDAEPHFGFGSHFNARIALDRAVSEMGQSWILGEQIIPNEINRKVTGRNLSTESFLRPPKGAATIPLSAFTNHTTNDFLSDIEKCVSILDDLGIEMLVTDLTRPEVGLSVVRVISPELVHFWPRFGAKRLYDTPVKLGWLDTAKTEKDLNPVPFYF